MNTNTNTAVTQADALTALRNFTLVMEGFITGAPVPTQGVTRNAAGRLVDTETKRFVAAASDASQPAKGVAKAPKAKAGKARKAPKANALSDRTDLGRKEWNNAVSKLTRSMGQHPSGVSVYRFVMDRWALVVTQRDAKATPRKAVEAVLSA